MKYLLLLLAGLQLTPKLHASSQNFSLEDFIELARKNDPNIQKIINQKLQIRFNKDLVLPNRQFLLTVENLYGLQVGGRTTSQLTGTLTKEFHHTGTSLSVSQSKNIQTDREEDTLNLRLEQSLYKNAFGSQTRLLDKRLSQEDELLILQTAEAYEDYIAELSRKYLDLELLVLDRASAESIYKDALTIQKNIENKKRSGIAAQVEVDRIRLQALQKQTEVLKITSEIEAQIQELQSLLGIKELNLPTPDPNKDLLIGKEQKVPSPETLLQIRSMRILAFEKSIPELNLTFEKNQSGPSLNLVLGQRYDQSTRFTTSTNRNETLLGFNFELPLGDSSQNANLERARYQLGQAEIDQVLSQRLLISNLTSLQQKILRQREIVSISGQKFELAKKVLAGEKVRYQNGRVDLETLVQSQNALSEHQLDSHSQRTTLNKLALEWLQLTDQLVSL